MQAMQPRRQAWLDKPERWLNPEAPRDAVEDTAGARSVKPPSTSRRSQVAFVASQEVWHSVMQTGNGEVSTAAPMHNGQHSDQITPAMQWARHDGDALSSVRGQIPTVADEIASRPQHIERSANGNSASRVFVDDIPDAPKPLHSQLKESRWAQAVPSKDATFKAHGVGINGHQKKAEPPAGALSISTPTQNERLNGTKGLTHLPEQSAHKGRQENVHPRYWTNGTKALPPHIQLQKTTANDDLKEKSTQVEDLQRAPNESAMDSLPPHRKQLPRHVVNIMAKIQQRHKSYPKESPFASDSNSQGPAQARTNPQGAALEPKPQQSVSRISDSVAPANSPPLYIMQSTGNDVSPGSPPPRFPYVASPTDIAVDRDPRGEESDGIYDDQDWDAPRPARPRKKQWDSESSVVDGTVSSSNGPAFASKGACSLQFMTWWLDAIPSQRASFLDQPTNSALSDVNEHQGVDPVTGQLMDEIGQPNSRRDYGRHNPDRILKLNSQTSQWSIGRYLSGIQASNSRKESEELEAEAERQARVLEERNANKKNPYLCRVPAHLRPAALGDMDEVTRIYNQEVREGWRAVDQEPLPATAWQNIFKACRREKLPFIVALSEYRNPNTAIEEAGHKVIGFAYLDVASRGVSGSVQSSARVSARLYVFVDPQHRRNRVGTALLDRICIMTSRSYICKEQSYQWETPSLDAAYFDEWRNARKYRTLTLEVYIENLGTGKKTEEGEEYQWIYNFLEEEFAFYKKLRTHHFAVKSDPEGFDIHLDRLIFEHRCIEFGAPGEG
ncbi:hypothetical protein JX265_002693 [Neoarthrinium moseri]|uniref:N-acetyltransferase domain-containing protein n=1 Tax=Neoarthrinium moseri TaxID=1658444 RepID=A0A9P9WUX6_9PEZI|nr:hypothetical protein JX265_002693 [Neoarthrinium moseri]